MVAFYERDPGAPRLPPASSSPWTRVFTRGVEGGEAWSTPSSSSSSSSSSSAASSSSSASSSSPLPSDLYKCGRVENAAAVVPVEPVIEKIGKSNGKESKMEGKETETKRERKRKRQSGGGGSSGGARLSLLSPSVFSYFEALNSGLTLTRRGVCSLNCGGKCESCKGLGGGGGGGGGGRGGGGGGGEAEREQEEQQQQEEQGQLFCVPCKPSSST